MHVFLITSGKIRLDIFAETQQQALAIFHHWSIATGTEVPDRFYISLRNTGWRGLDQNHILAALERNEPGIGSYDPASGWTNSPPDEPWGRS